MAYTLAHHSHFSEFDKRSLNKLCHLVPSVLWRSIHRCIISFAALRYCPLWWIPGLDEKLCAQSSNPAIITECHGQLSRKPERNSLGMFSLLQCVFQFWSELSFLLFYFLRFCFKTAFSSSAILFFSLLTLSPVALLRIHPGYVMLLSVK